jgi:hypothetical protein
MAKVRAAHTRRANGSPKPQTPRARTAAVNIRTFPAWKEWVDEFAEFDRCSLVELFDRALVSYAREKKFPKPAPRR